MIKICEQLADQLPRYSAAEMLVSECPVDQALKIVTSARNNLCGHGVFCRDGVAQLYRIISDIQDGKGLTTDLELILDICGAMIVGGDCELSIKTAETVRTLVTEFGDEWLAHITRRKCSALKCRKCYTLHILPEVCTGCGMCLTACPRHAITGGTGMIHVILQEQCDQCDLCISACERSAVVKAGMKKPQCPDAPVPVGSFEGGRIGRRRHGNR